MLAAAEVEPEATLLLKLTLTIFGLLDLSTTTHQQEELYCFF